MKTTSILLATLFTLVGCSPAIEFPLTVHLDESWSAEETEEIASVFEEWKIATGGMVKYELVEGYPHVFDPEENFYPDNNLHVIYKLSPSEFDALRESEGAGEGTVGLTSRGNDNVSQVIAIDVDRLFEGALRRTVMHEVGHLIGFRGHVEEGESLMNTGMDPEVAQLSCIVSITLARSCGDVYDCEPHPTCTE